MWPFVPSLRVRVREHLAGFERRSVALDGRRHAAVAVVLTGDDEGRACFLLTLRAPSLRSHAAQFALPGGKLDDGETAEAAALRELEEELGVVMSPASRLGLLDDYPTRSGYVITPVVLFGEALTITPNPDEVAMFFRVPLEELDDPELPRSRPSPPERPIVYYPLLGTTIHAPTAAILHQLVEVGLHGRATRVHHYDEPEFARR